MDERIPIDETTGVALEPCDIPTCATHAAARVSSGVRDLMLAVLDDAIHSLSSSQHLVRREAEHWIASAESNYVFSFVVICETLALVPSAVRRSVIAQMSRKPAGGRLLRRSRPNVRRKGIMAATERVEPLRAAL